MIWKELLGLAEELPIHAIESLELGSHGKVNTFRIEETAATYVRSSLAIQPHGPFRLAGYSFGGVVAHEMACQLTAQGHTVEFLGLFETHNPASPTRNYSTTERLRVCWGQSAGQPPGQRLSLLRARVSEGQHTRRRVRAELNAATSSGPAEAYSDLRRIQVREENWGAMQDHQSGTLIGVAGGNGGPAHHPAAQPQSLTPDMRDGLVQIHLIRPDGISPEEADRCLAADEKSRAARFHFPRDASHWSRCRAALRMILSGQIGMPPSEVPLIYSDFGKPLLPPPWDSVHFNLSHCEDLALVAVSRAGPVGVDLERLSRAPDLLECEPTKISESSPSSIRGCGIIWPPFRPRRVGFWRSWFSGIQIPKTPDGKAVIF